MTEDTLHLRALLISAKRELRTCGDAEQLALTNYVASLENSLNLATQAERAAQAAKWARDNGEAFSDGA